MCILFIYRNPSADVKSYRLIIASNRDEAYKRPAASAHYWEKHPECLGGMIKISVNYLKQYCENSKHNIKFKAKIYFLKFI